MPPKSKSNRRRSKFVPKPKQEWRVKQPTRNWLELPSDLTRNILQRVGVVDRLENAQKVCTAWREICKDPAMWRVVYMDAYAGVCADMFKHVVDRSQGQLLDLTIVGFCDDIDLLQYVVDRSSQLRRLEIIQYVYDFCEMWSDAFKNLPSLEELCLVNVKICKQDIEAAGRYCPLLKILKVNKKAARSCDADDDDEIPLAIGKNLTELTHLELIGNNMINTGLQAILDGCCHLESLDLRRCLYIDLGDLGRRCLQQIKCLKLPRDSIEELVYSGYDLCDSDFEFVSGDEYDQYLDYYDEYPDYDDYTAYDNDIDNLSGISLESLGEMMAFMSMFE
ncbi:F-box protein SKIP19-like [Bidens hawaiensis]|uniref:F-box protein SKIP19-like n=1 Tax=Bidens hawaiensis TaxID=980011 RepID=UPI004049CF5F